MLLKIFVFILIFAILFLIREGFLFYKAIQTGEKNMTVYRLFGIGAALAYIFTIIFTGFTF